MKVSELSILLVEDDLFYAGVLADFLRGRGYHDIRHAKSGVDCMLQVFEERAPSVVIMDYNLHQLNGLSIMQKLLHYLPELQVIIISNQVDIKVAIQAMKLGAADYLRKNELLFEQLAATLKQFSPPVRQNKVGKKFRKFWVQTLDFYNDAFLGISKS